MSDSCDPVDCNLLGFSVHGILQARILEWVAISFSMGSSQPKNRTWDFCIAGRFFTNWAMRDVWGGGVWTSLNSPDGSLQSRADSGRGYNRTWLDNGNEGDGTHQNRGQLLTPWDSPGTNTGVGCYFLLQCLAAAAADTLINPVLSTFHLISYFLKVIDLF